MKLKVQKNEEEPESFNAVDVLLERSRSISNANGFAPTHSELYALRSGTPPRVALEEFRPMDGATTEFEEIQSRAFIYIPLREVTVESDCDSAQIGKSTETISSDSDVLTTALNNMTSSSGKNSGHVARENLKTYGGDLTPLFKIPWDTKSAVARQDSPDKNLGCPLCPYQTFFAYQLKRHVLQTHGLSLNDESCGSESGTQHEDPAQRMVLDQLMFDRKIVEKINDFPVVSNFSTENQCSDENHIESIFTAPTLPIGHPTIHQISAQPLDQNSFASKIPTLDQNDALSNFERSNIFLALFHPMLPTLHTPCEKALPVDPIFNGEKVPPPASMLCYEKAVPAAAPVYPRGLEWRRLPEQTIPYRVKCQACNFYATNDKFLKIHIGKGQHDINMVPIHRDFTKSCEFPPVNIKLLLMPVTYEKFVASQCCINLQLTEVETTRFWCYQHTSDSLIPLTPQNYDILRCCLAFTPCGKCSDEQLEVFGAFSPTDAADGITLIDLQPCPHLVPRQQAAAKFKPPAQSRPQWSRAVATLSSVNGVVDSIVQKAKHYAHRSARANFVIGMIDEGDDSFSLQTATISAAGTEPDDSAVEIVWEHPKVHAALPAPIDASTALKCSATISCQICSVDILANICSARNHMKLCHNIEGQILCRNSTLLLYWWNLLMKKEDENFLMTTKEFIALTGQRIPLDMWNMHNQSRNYKKRKTQNFRWDCMPEAFSGLYVCPFCLYNNSFRFVVKRHLMVQCKSARNAINCVLQAQCKTPEKEANELYTNKTVPPVQLTQKPCPPAPGKYKEKNAEFFECLFCGYTVFCYDTLVHHLAGCRAEFQFHMDSYNSAERQLNDIFCYVPTKDLTRIKMDTKDVVFMCLFCSSVRSRRKDLQEHMIRYHWFAIKSIVANPSQPFPEATPSHDSRPSSSGLSVTSARSVKQHSNAVKTCRGHAEKIYACRYCDRIAYKMWAMRCHVQSCHVKDTADISVPVHSSFISSFEVIRKKRKIDTVEGEHQCLGEKSQNLTETGAFVAFEKNSQDEKTIPSCSSVENFESETKLSTNESLASELDEKSNSPESNETNWDGMVQTVNQLISNLSNAQASQKKLTREKTDLLQNLIQNIQHTVGPKNCMQ